MITTARAIATTLVATLVLVGLVAAPAQAAGTVTVSGHVDLDTAGNPAGSTQVMVTLGAREIATGLIDYSQYSSTDASGNFVFTSVAPAPAGLEYVLGYRYYAYDEYYEIATAPPTPGFQVGASDIVRPSVVLLRMAALSGNLTGDSGPLNYAQVIVRKYDPETMDELVSRGGRTAADGSWRVGGLTAGRYTVEFADDQYTRGYLDDGWPNVPPYYYPQFIDIGATEQRSGLDEQMVRGGSINVLLTGASSSADRQYMSLSVEFWDDESEDWVSTGEEWPVTSISQSAYPLYPMRYRAVVTYAGPKGTVSTESGPIDVGSGSSTNVTLSLDVPVSVAPGTLVKTASSSTVYFVASDRIVRVDSLSIADDFGLSRSVQTVPDSWIASWPVDSKPLSNFVQCGSENYTVMLATAGGLTDYWGFAPEWRTVFSDPYLCENLRGGKRTSSTPTFKNGSTLWGVTTDGVKHKVVASSSSWRVYSESYPTAVNSWFLDQLPTGGVRAADGRVVKFGTSSQRYLQDGYSHLVPLDSLSSVIALGMDPSAVTLPASAKADYAEVEDQPLSVIVSCRYSNSYSGGIQNTNTVYIGSGGKRYPLSSDYAGVLPTTSLEGGGGSACANSGVAFVTKPKFEFPSTISELFVRSAETGTAYYLTHDGTKRRVLTWTAVKAALGIANPKVLTVPESFLARIPAAPDILSVGMIVKSGAGKLFVFDGSGLVPLPSVDIATPFGLSGTVLAVSSATASQLPTRPQPLSPLVTCGGVLMLGANGRLVPVPADAFPGFTPTPLSDALCAKLTRSGVKLTRVFVRAASSSMLFWVDAGVRRRVVSSAQQAALARPGGVATLTLPASFVLSIPRGTDAPLATTSLVRSSSTSSALYFVDGDTRYLLPWTGIATDLGIGTASTVVPVTRITQLVRSPQPLSNVVACLGQTWVAASGKLWPVDPATVAGIHSSPLSDDACTVLNRSEVSPGAKVFLKSRASGTIYLLENGVRRKLLSSTSVAHLSAPGTSTVLTVDTNFLAKVPKGPDVLDAGLLIQGSGTAMWVLDGAGGRIPVASTALATDFGLGTTPAKVSSATVLGFALHPKLTNLVSCDGSAWIAGKGRLYQIPADAVGALPVSDLGAALCAVLPRSSSSMLAGAVVRTAPTSQPYYLSGGVRHKIGSTATLMALTGGTGTAAVVNTAFVVSIPSGPPIP